MEKYSNILQFSRDLFLHCSEIPLPAEDKTVLNPPKFMRAATITLQAFCDAFCVKLRKVYKKHSFEVMDSDIEFLRYTIPRCLKLIDDDHYFFSFMLVAAFIEELLQYLEFRKDCYRFAGTAYKCLAAVFKRQFEGTFEEKGGWKGLRSFCDKIAYVKDPRKEIKTKADFLTGGNLILKKRVCHLIKKCDNLNDEFMFNNYELSLIDVDDELQIEAELSNHITVTNDSILQVRWTMLEDNKIFQVFSCFDDNSGRVISTRIRYASSDILSPTSLDPSSVIETPTVSNQSSDIETPTVSNQSSDIETPTVPDQSSDIETPTVPDQSSDIETPTVRDQSSDNETPTVPDQPSDTDTHTVLNQSLDIDTHTVRNQSSDIETPTVRDQSSNIETTSVLYCSLDSKYSTEDDVSLNESKDIDFDDTDLEKFASMRFAYRIVYELEPEEFDRKMSTRICQFCNKRCFQYAKYVFRKHGELSKKPKMFRTKSFLTNSLKAIRKMFSKNA